MRYLIKGYSLPRVHLPRISIDNNRDEHKDVHDHDPIVSHVKRRVNDPPESWESYSDSKSGAMSIVEMEYNELMAKKSEGSHAGMEKELTDLAAACISALHKFKSM